jgi:hypothetical protein
MKGVAVDCSPYRSYSNRGGGGKRDAVNTVLEPVCLVQHTKHSMLTAVQGSYREPNTCINNLNPIRHQGHTHITVTFVLVLVFVLLSRTASNWLIIVAQETNIAVTND